MFVSVLESLLPFSSIHMAKVMQSPCHSLWHWVNSNNKRDIHRHVGGLSFSYIS